MDIRNILKTSYVLLDGAMGTSLQNCGLPIGENAELLNISNPSMIASVHGSFAAVGSRIIYTNTFQANRYKLPNGISVDAVVASAVGIARNAAPHCFVALDIGSTGKLIEPMGAMTFEEAYEIFKEVVLAGVKAGADLIVLETFTSLYEMRAAVLAAKENSDLPLICSMSFDGLRTVNGTTIASMALTLEALGADVIGFNCSMGANAMLPLVTEVVKWTNLPIIVKANAGIPNGEVLTAKDFGQCYKRLIEAGATIIGGCCGTTPEYIAELNKLISGAVPTPRAKVYPKAVCNENSVTLLKSTQVVGERINPTGKKLYKQALINGDYNLVIKEAVTQKDDGAVILDVNAGLPELDEPTVLCKMIKLVQGELPLMIDTTNPIALEEALRIYNGVAIVNSVNGDAASMNSVLPLVKKYGAYVVGLTLDASGIPLVAEARIKIAERIIAAAQRYNIAKDKVIIDALTLTVATGEYRAAECIKTIEHLTKNNISTVLGISNVSFGLPNRDIINATFLAHAMWAGLTLAIINPHISLMMATINAEQLLKGEPAIATAPLIAKNNEAEKISLQSAIIRGLREEAKVQAAEMLLSASASDIIDNHLIKALDEVGARYEAGTIFLPELISAAEAAKEVCNILKGSLSTKGSVTKGKIILATVKGDIHDIGKNIVKAVIENYGYEVLDLGKDVAVETIVETAISENVMLIGLSALMTTTATNMEKSVAALKAAGYRGKVMVGGAVITREYAKKIGADYYAKDANESVKIAKICFGN